MIDIIDLEELVCRFCNVDYDEWLETEDPTLDTLLYNKCEISLEQFSDIANFLITLTPPLKSELTGSEHHVFGIREDGYFRAIAKI